MRNICQERERGIRVKGTIERTLYDLHTLESHFKLPVAPFVKETTQSVRVCVNKRVARKRKSNNGISIEKESE